MSILDVENQTVTLSGNPKYYSVIDVGTGGDLVVNTQVFTGLTQVTGSSGYITATGSGFLEVVSPFYQVPTLVYASGIIQFVGALTEDLTKNAKIVRHAIPSRGELLQWTGLSAPEISIKGLFTGSDCINLRSALESIWQNGTTGSLYLGGIDLADPAIPYNIFLDEPDWTLQGGYFPSNIGQGYLPYNLKFIAIT